MKDNRSATLLGCFLAAVMIAAALFTGGCTNPPPTPKSTPSPTPAATPKTEPIVLKAVSMLPKTDRSVHFVGVFADRVNERSKGDLKINWLGGPEVLPMAQIQTATSTGVMDIGVGLWSTYFDRLPEVRAYTLSEFNLVEERRNGFYDWNIELHKQKMNMQFLSRMINGRGWELFTNVYLNTPKDIVGKKVGATGSNLTFANAIGAAGVVLPPGADVYSYMQQRMIDASINSLPSMDAIKINEVCKWIVPYQIYEANACAMYMNLGKWNQLPKSFQDLITNIVIEMEPEIPDYFIKDRDSSRNHLLAAGMQLNNWSPEDVQWYVDASRLAGWKDVKENVSPETYTKLRGFLTKK
jgi:TRAP-type C4-dicarboxylate transport system substrate-binding protein